MRGTWGEPYHIYPEIVEIVQLRDDAWNVADPVAIAVAEAGRVDLIDAGFFPPSVVCCGGFGHGCD